MARILAISSQVVRGHVGLSATVPALQRLGHEVWALPTIILSNHPGHPIAAGTRVEPQIQTQMLEALEHNGWLDEIDAIITGYLPSPGHVRVAADIIRLLKAQRSIAYLCDPVLGDDAKGLYLDQPAALALRDELIAMADIATPNRFELGWLAGEDVQTIAAVQVAASALSVKTVIVTSAAQQDGRISTLMVHPEGNYVCDTAWQPDVPHGTGDFFAALVLGYWLNSESAPMALGRAAAAVDVAIAASAGRNELELSASQEAWAHAAPLPARRLPGVTGEEP
jgi:pyridoxine kinase